MSHERTSLLVHDGESTVANSVADLDDDDDSDEYTVVIQNVGYVSKTPEVLPKAVPNARPPPQPKHDSPQLLRINVGCKSFLMQKKWILDRGPIDSLLAEFIKLSHEERLQKCDGYNNKKGEYCFERSSKLFHVIFKYYVNGTIHRPLDTCLQEFMDELSYWSIPTQCMNTCCSPKMMDNDINSEETVDLFEGLCCAKVRRALWRISEGDGSLKSKLFSVFSIGLVMVSVSGLIISSIPDFQMPVNHTSYEGFYSIPNFVEGEPVVRMEPWPFFYHLETVCILWFSIEYVLRLLIAPAKFAFLIEALNMVDLLAILPFYLELTLQLAGIDSEDLRNFKFALLMVRLLRSLRVMRILKVSRYSVGLRIFAMTLKSSASQLAMVVMVFSIGVVFFSSMVYFMEKDEPGSPFQSIPIGFWWCIVTMTTVGYGDIVPLTAIGKIVASAAIVCGVLVLALPITIMVDNFMKVATK